MITTAREDIKGMKPTEAVEHLLYILETLTGDRRAILRNMVDKDLTPALSRIYTMLQKANGQAVSYEALQLTASKSFDGGITKSCLTAQMSYLRKALPPNERIINIREYGFKLIID